MSIKNFNWDKWNIEGNIREGIIKNINNIFNYIGSGWKYKKNLKINALSNRSFNLYMTNDDQ